MGVQRKLKRGGVGIQVIARLGVCLLWAGVAFADDAWPGDELGLVSAMEPVGEAILAEARGGAALPDGLGIEVTALMRVLADGEDLLTVSSAWEAGAHGLAAQQIVLQGQNVPVGESVFNNPLIVNAMDGVSLEQYREVTIHLSNLPVGTGAIPIVPSLSIPGIPTRY